MIIRAVRLGRVICCLSRLKAIDSHLLRDLFQVRVGVVVKQVR
jgi:hypothetical protein